MTTFNGLAFADVYPVAERLGAKQIPAVPFDHVKVQLVALAGSQDAARMFDFQIAAHQVVRINRQVERGARSDIDEDDPIGFGAGYRLHCNCQADRPFQAAVAD